MTLPSPKPENDSDRPSPENISIGGDSIGAIVGAGAQHVVVGKNISVTTTVITEEQAYNVHGLPNPYLGLRAFTYADRAIYAGREQLAQEAVAYLTSPGSPRTILFITGASGSGKSSFAQAALLPQLEAHYTQDIIGNKQIG